MKAFFNFPFSSENRSTNSRTITRCEVHDHNWKKGTYLWIRSVDGGHHPNQKAHADYGNSSWFLHPRIGRRSGGGQSEENGGGWTPPQIHVGPTNTPSPIDCFPFTPGSCVCVCVSTTTSNVEIIQKGTKSETFLATCSPKFHNTKSQRTGFSSLKKFGPFQKISHEK